MWPICLLFLFLQNLSVGAFPPSALYARKDLLQRSTHIATKTFQAFRIFVNNELNELYTGLETAQKFLRPGGHLVALSFHSLEDRIIKRFLLGISMTERFNLSARQKVIQKSQLDSDQENKKHVSVGKAPLTWKLMHKKVLTPEDQDVQDNPRGRSAKLRAAIKLWESFHHLILQDFPHSFSCDIPGQPNVRKCGISKAI